MVAISWILFQTSVAVLCALHSPVAVQSAPAQTTSLSETQDEGSGAPIGAIPTASCSSKEVQGITQKLLNLFISSRTIQEAIFGAVPNRPIPKIGLYSARIFKQSQQSASFAVAESVQYFMCFVEPVADALKNETYRAIVQRARDVYTEGFVYILTNLTVAIDMYELVHRIPLGTGYTPNVTNSTATCSPIVAPTAVSGITPELTYVGAIASELSNLSDDIRVQFRNLAC